MFQISTILLVFLVKTSSGVDSCQALFVVDGSDLWTSFRGEILSIQAAANSAFASSSSLFSANFWVYGDEKQDQEIPNYFFVSYPEFLNELEGASTYGGKEYVDAVTNKLNEYPNKRVIILLYTASSQNLINNAGKTYKGQAKTVVVHQNDGIDASPISNYPSPSSSDSKQIAELIVQACHDLPPAPGCPNNWSYFEVTDSCYYLQNFINNTTPNGTIWQSWDWPTAETNCQEMGGHLVSIHSKDEDNFVYDLVYSNVFNQSDVAPENYPCLYQKAWIGLDGNGTIGGGTWTDGTPVDYVGYGAMTSFNYYWTISNDPSCKYHMWDYQYNPKQTLSRFVCEMASIKG